MHKTSIRFLGLLLVGLLFCSTLLGQTATITGNGTYLGTGTGTLQLQLQLVSCTGNTPLVNGTSLLNPLNYVFTADNSGTATGNVYGNNIILCGTQNYSLWAVTWIFNGLPVSPTAQYRLTEGNTCNISDGTCKPVGFVPAQIGNSAGAYCSNNLAFIGFDINYKIKCAAITNQILNFANIVAGLGYTPLQDIVAGTGIGVSGSGQTRTVINTSPFITNSNSYIQTIPSNSQHVVNSENPLTIDSISIGNQTFAPINNQYEVHVGDSTVAGYLLNNPSTESWPAQLNTFPILHNRATLVNNGIPGETCEGMTSNYSTQVLPYKPNGTTIKKTYLFVGPIGRNNLTEDSSTIFNCIKSYVSQAKSDGFTVILSTILPSSTEASPTLSNTVVNITAVTANQSNGTMTFFGTNSFTGGEHVFVQGLNSTPTLNGTTASLTGCSGNGTSVTLTGTNLNSVTGNAIVVSGFTGACASLNTLWQFPTTRNNTSITVPFAATISSASDSGTIAGSTGAGANCANNVFTISATGLSNSQFTTDSNFSPSYCSGNYTNQPNTGTATVTAFRGWDAITYAASQTLEDVNKKIRLSAICNSSVTTNCSDYLIDLAQDLSDPNDPVQTLDGTHPSAELYSQFAIRVQSTLIGYGSTKPALPINSLVNPVFKGLTTSYFYAATGCNTTRPIDSYFALYHCNDAGWLDSFNTNSQTFKPVNIRAYQINIGLGADASTNAGIDTTGFKFNSNYLCDSAGNNCPGFTAINGTTGNIGGSSLNQGDCAHGTATMSANITSSMFIGASPSVSIGLGWSVRAEIINSTTAQVSVCNESSTPQTPIATSYNVRAFN